MSRPVIFDDGGSLRIREMQDLVFMDDLMRLSAAPVASNQTFVTGGVFQCTLTVRYLDEDGVLTVVPSVGTPPIYGLALASGDTVTIKSLIRSAVVAFKNNVLNVNVSTTANASQEDVRRRYVVAHFGRIIKVIHSNGTVFDLTGIARSYTMVHFSPNPRTGTIANQVVRKEDDEGRHHHHY